MFHITCLVLLIDLALGDGFSSSISVKGGANARLKITTRIRSPALAYKTWIESSFRTPNQAPASTILVEEPTSNEVASSSYGDYPPSLILLEDVFATVR